MLKAHRNNRKPLAIAGIALTFVAGLSIVAVHAFGPFYASKCVLPQMRTQKRGEGAVRSW